MGVAGSGKTRVGRALADRLGWQFFDADDFHPLDNIARMRSGIPLTDVHREPWLEDLRARLLTVQAESANAVLACSALRSRFRERLRAGIPDLHYVYLRANRDTIAARLTGRSGHFMPAGLLDSQFETLEEPDDALLLDASEPPDVLVDRIRGGLDV